MTWLLFRNNEPVGVLTPQQVDYWRTYLRPHDDGDLDPYEWADGNDWHVAEVLQMGDVRITGAGKRHRRSLTVYWDGEADESGEDVHRLRVEYAGAGDESWGPYVPGCEVTRRYYEPGGESRKPGLVLEVHGDDLSAVNSAYNEHLAAIEAEPQRSVYEAWHDQAKQQHDGYLLTRRLEELCRREENAGFAEWIAAHEAPAKDQEEVAE